MKTVFASMDWESDTLQLYVSPVQPNFRVTTENKATAAVSEVEYSRTDDQFFTAFNCRRSQVWRYSTRHLRAAVAALANAAYTRLRINSAGALRMEHIVNLDERNAGFAVFTVLSNKTFLDSGGCDLYAGNAAIGAASVVVGGNVAGGEDIVAAAAAAGRNNDEDEENEEGEDDDDDGAVEGGGRKRCEGAFGGNEVEDGMDRMMGGDSFIRDVKSEMAADSNSSNNPYGWSDDIKRSTRSTSPELK